MSSNVWVGIGLAVLLAGLFVFRYTTRAGVIARATTKEAIRQPVFALLTVVAIALILINYYIPFFSMGDDTKMYIDCGLATVLICSLLLAIWTASTSVADEIEGKTAMTLLSKPINRRQFIVGKYVGILQASLLMIAIVGVTLMVATYFKMGYDAKESSQEPPPRYVTRTIAGMDVPTPEPTRLAVAARILPALALLLMETAVMTALSVAISTRATMLMNIVVCFTIFVVSHLTPTLVASTLQGFPPVKLLAQVFATVLPSLDAYNSSVAVATGAEISPSYLGLTMAYTAAYIVAAVLLGFILFEDRDLA